MRILGRLLIGVLMLLWVAGAGAQVMTTVYSHDFETSVGREWSHNIRTLCPNHTRTFLGRFGDDNVRLNLVELPEHCSVTVSFDLLIIGSWEGSTGYFAGPDLWDLNASVPDDCCPVENLLHATFANCSCRYQSYPDTFPNVFHPGLTGAEEVDTLGYEQDSVYHMSFTFYHHQDELQLSFDGGPMLQILDDESWGIDNILVQVDSESCCRAIRYLPVNYAAGNDVPVKIEVDPNHEAQAYVLEENPPSGWAVSSMNDGGVFDEAAGLIKWGPFFGDAPRTLEYTLSVPTGVAGDFSFDGSISVDGTSEMICGDSEISAGSYHPADTNRNWVISDDEVTAYAASWRLGDPWSIEPEVIPGDFVTNAGLIWKAGGSYVFDGNANPPWVAVGGSKRGQGELLSSAGTDVVLDGVPVTMRLEVHPGTGTQAYLVQDRIPAGFKIVETGGGIFDAAGGVLRFGPFFDDQERSFSYRVVRLGSASLTAVFHATASFDGFEVEQGGTRILQSVGLITADPPAIR